MGLRDQRRSYRSRSTTSSRAFTDSWTNRSSVSSEAPDPDRATDDGSDADSAEWIDPDPARVHRPLVEVVPSVGTER